MALPEALIAAMLRVLARVIKFTVGVAGMDFLGDRKLTLAAGGGDGLVALGADRIDGGIAVFSSGERDKSGHSVSVPISPWRRASGMTCGLVLGADYGLGLLQVCSLLHILSA